MHRGISILDYSTLKGLGTLYSSEKENFLVLHFIIGQLKGDVHCRKGHYVGGSSGTKRKDVTTMSS